MKAGTPLDARGVPDDGKRLQHQLQAELQGMQDEIAAAPASVIVDRALAAALEMLVRAMDRYTEAVARQDMSAAHSLEAGGRWLQVLEAWVLVQRLRRSKPLTHLVGLADVELRAIASHEDGAAFEGGKLTRPEPAAPSAEASSSIEEPDDDDRAGVGDTHNAHHDEFPGTHR